MTVKRRKKKDPALKRALNSEAFARAVLTVGRDPGEEIPLHDVACAEVEGSGSCTCDPIVLTVGEKAQA